MLMERVAELLERVKDSRPLIHNITNVVVTNFTANGLLALGASPVMAYAKEEVADMARIANALVLNIGTLTAENVEAMLIAGKAAGENGVPIILDPVGAGATPYRTEVAQRLLEQLPITVLRGNAAEVANCIGRSTQIKGVDDENAGDALELTQAAAKQLGTTVVVTGASDVVSDGRKTYIVRNGHPMLTKVTGAGCLLTSVVGAFTAVLTDKVDASAAALAVYGIAAELAAEATMHRGPGSFQIELLNQLARVQAVDIVRKGKLELQLQ